MKTILLLSFLLVSQFALAQGPKASEADTMKMKSCLAEVYSKQTIYQNSNGQYATQAKKLGLQNSQYCKGIKLDFKKVSKDSFSVKAQLGKMVWSVDDSKAMIQIK